MIVQGETKGFRVEKLKHVKIREIIQFGCGVEKS